MITHNKKYYRYHSDGVSGTVMVTIIKIITIIPSNDDDDDDDDNDNDQALIIQYKTSTVYFLELP